MKRLLTSLLLVTFVFSNLDLLIAQQKPTEIFIIGLFHNANAVRTKDSLYHIVSTLKPDIILSEMDTISLYFKSDYSMVQPPWWYPLSVRLRLKKGLSPEHAICYHYKKVNPQVLIYPFDIDIPNRSRHVKASKNFENMWVNEINKANHNDEIPNSFKEKLKKHNTFSNYLFSLRESGYSFLNRPIVTDSIRMLMHNEYALMPALFDTLPRLKPYKERYINNTLNWQKRNEVMVENILKFTSMHSGKRVVILTGLLHKYILEDLLTPHIGMNKEIVLKDFLKEN